MGGQAAEPSPLPGQRFLTDVLLPARSERRRIRRMICSHLPDSFFPTRTNHSDCIRQLCRKEPPISSETACARAGHLPGGMDLLLFLLQCSSEIFRSLLLISVHPYPISPFTFLCNRLFCLFYASYPGLVAPVLDSVYELFPHYLLSAAVFCANRQFFLNFYQLFINLLTCCGTMLMRGNS